MWTWSTRLAVILALDVGEAKIGAATGSTEARLARPYAVWRSRGSAKDTRRIAEAVDELRATVLLVGLPLQEDGSRGLQAERIRRYVEPIAAELSLPLLFLDETLSTQDAQRQLLEGGSGRRRRQGLEDAAAAAVILQRYLDSACASGELPQ